MKKILHSSLIILLLLTSIHITATAIPSHQNNTIHEIITLHTPILTEENGYTHIKLPESDTYLTTINTPMLPTITKTYYLPFQSQIHTFNLKTSQISEYTLQKPIVPTPTPQPLDTPNKPRYSTSNPIYSSATPYPNQDYTITLGTGLHNNQHVTIVTLTINPIQYIPAENIIKIAEQMTYTISYTTTPNSIIPTETTIDMIVISPAEYTTAIQPLIEHINSIGITTQHTLDTDIYTHYPGRDHAEQIKYYIKDMVETHDIKYVLFMGSVLHVPIRYTAIDVWNEDNIPTDLYYADIYDANGDFCSWDSNHNDLFGEFDWDLGPIDQVDLYPDVHIGRIPCTTVNQVTDMVNKIIIYETTTKGSPWFEKIIYMAGDTFPNHGNIEGEFVTSKIIEQRPEFTPIKLWTSQGNYGPFNINLAITQGAGFISYSGHGYEQGFGTSEPNVEKRIEYYSPFLIGLFNKNKFPIVFFDACSTTKLDFDMAGFEEWYPVMSTLIKTLEGNNYDPSEHFPCFSWQIMKKPTTGAIATIGATRVAFTHVNAGGIYGGAGYLNLHFFMAYEPGITVAEMLTSAQNDYISNVGKDCVTLEEFILLGDPSLKTGGY